MSDEILSLEQYLAECPANPADFKPYAHYNKDSDQLEVYWADDPCFAEPIVGLTAMHLLRSHSEANADVCGVTVYGIKKLLRDAGYELVPQNPLVKIRFKRDVEGTVDGKPYQTVFKQGEVYEARRLPEQLGEEGIEVRRSDGGWNRFWRRKSDTPNIYVYEVVEENNGV